MHGISKAHTLWKRLQLEVYTTQLLIVKKGHKSLASTLTRETKRWSLWLLAYLTSPALMDHWQGWGGSREGAHVARLLPPQIIDMCVIIRAFTSESTLWIWTGVLCYELHWQACNCKLKCRKQFNLLSDQTYSDEYVDGLVKLTISDINNRVYLVLFLFA